MPWCPKCASEYKPEIENCADCECSLVEQAPLPRSYDTALSFLKDMIKPVLLSILAIILPMFLVPFVSWALFSLGEVGSLISFAGPYVLIVLSGFCYGYFCLIELQFFSSIFGCIVGAIICVTICFCGIIAGLIPNPIGLVVFVPLGVLNSALTLLAVHLGFVIRRRKNS